MGKRRRVISCCFVGCHRPADFVIQTIIPGRTTPEPDTTHSCEGHVGMMLTVPMDLSAAEMQQAHWLLYDTAR